MNDARNAIHVALTAVMAWLAIILALPGDTFSRSHSFDLMARMAPEGAWAMAFWMVASVGAVGAVSPGRAVRLASVLTLSTAHGALAALLGLASPYTTASGTYGILALLGYYLAYRRTREVL